MEIVATLCIFQCIDLKMWCECATDTDKYEFARQPADIPDSLSCHAPSITLQSYISVRACVCARARAQKGPCELHAMARLQSWGAWPSQLRLQCLIRFCPVHTG